MHTRLFSPPGVPETGLWELRDVVGSQEGSRRQTFLSSAQLYVISAWPQGLSCQCKEEDSLAKWVEGK